eukprot:347701-Chlamydomonas_euryale.AAC.2
MVAHVSCTDTGKHVAACPQSSTDVPAKLSHPQHCTRQAPAHAKLLLARGRVRVGEHTCGCKAAQLKDATQVNPKIVHKLCSIAFNVEPSLYAGKTCMHSMYMFYL